MPDVRDDRTREDNALTIAKFDIFYALQVQRDPIALSLP
jgi:hypothetical protein